MGDDDAPWGFVPVAVFVEAAVGADGANDAVCRRWVNRGFLHDFFESESEAAGALLEEVQGVCMTVDCGSMAEIEFPGQVAGPPPHEESFLDGVALRVMANGAVDLMVVESGALALAAIWAAAMRFSCGFVSRFGNFWWVGPRIEPILEV